MPTPRQGQALDFGRCELRLQETALMTIDHVRWGCRLLRSVLPF